MMADVQSIGSVRTVFNDTSYDEELLEAFRLGRKEVGDLKVLDPMLGKTLDICLYDVINTLKPLKKITIPEITVCHLILYLYETRYRYDCISINQIRVINMGKMYKHVDLTKLSSFDYNTFHVMINRSLPPLEQSILSVLESRDLSVTYVQGVSKKLGKLKSSLKFSDTDRKNRTGSKIMKKMRNLFCYNEAYAAMVYDSEL